MTLSITDSSAIMLSVNLFCYAECQYAECHYVEPSGAVKKPYHKTVSDMFLSALPLINWLIH
jgi:hypothetical protein